MFHKFEGWNKAPKGTTHFCVQNCGSPWLKVDKEGWIYYHQGTWCSYGRKAEGHPHMEGAIERPKKVVVKPYTRGLMTLEQLKLMKAYEQIVAFVKLNHKGKFFEETVEAVCQRYLCNFNKLKAHRVENVKQKNYSIMSSFVWSDTREGKGYWIAIHHCERYEVLPLVKPEEEPVAEPKGKELADKVFVKPAKKAKVYVPLKAGDVLTAENLRNTEAYAQIKRFIERNNGTPAQQGKLVKMFLAEFNRQKDWPCKDIVFVGSFHNAFNARQDIDQAFCWRDSVDGDGFWTTVYATRRVNLKDFLNGAKAGPAGAPIVPPAIERKVEAPEVPKEMPKAPEVKKPAAKVGWW